MSHTERASASPAVDNYLTHTRGLRSWLFTLDHKRIGVMYMVGILASFALGGLMALLVRTELAQPGPTIMQHLPRIAAATTETPGDTGMTATDAKNNYNHAFTLHGAVMIFLVIIPGIPAILGNFVLPLMLGAKDLAFPRLNLASLWLWFFGAIFFIAVLHLGGLDTGWTFYTPYSSGPTHSSASTTSIALAVLGAFILGFSSIFTGLNFIVTIHKMRPPGMSWFRMPLFVWATYATSIIQVLATPVLGITLMLLAAERLLQIGIFDPALGGDPVLFQHFFWFYSHPAVYIMILPGMGIISEVVSVFSRKHIFGYRFIAFSSIAIALWGFLVWGHHMFVSGMTPLAATIFSALTFSVSIPSAIKVFNWLATMYRGSVGLATPMCYALLFIFLFGIGGLTGLFLGTLSVNVHVTDSYFIVAHFHYVMLGSTFIAMLAGIYHWWPKITGRMFNDRLGQLGCLLNFIGINLTFFPQFVLGSRGMPRRYFDYTKLLDANPEFFTLHFMSTVGAFVTLAGMLVVLYTLLDSVFRGKRAPANPWGGVTLEWATPSPPPHDNFADTPSVGEPYEYKDLEYDPDEGGFVYRPKPAERPSEPELAPT